MATKRIMAASLCGMLMFTACSTGWEGEAEQIVAVLIPAVANLVALSTELQGRTVSANDLQTIEKAGAQAGTSLQLMQSLIAQYQKADAAAQPGILSQLQAAINGVQADLNGLLPALHIEDPATQTKIAAVVGIVLSEVESVAAIVPLVNAVAPKMTAFGIKKSQKRLPLGTREFVSSYNATMTAKSGNTVLDCATQGMQIHSHGKLARWWGRVVEAGVTSRFERLHELNTSGAKA